MKVVAAMIVKNEEKCLKDCLNSLLLQDINEIIVCDTGSTDNTVAIASTYSPKIQVFTDYKWEDNFAKARNHVLSKVTDGDWVVSIDADEELMPGSLTLIRKAIETNPKVISIGITVRAKGTGQTTVAPRVFKKCEEMFWQGAAHNYLSKKAQIAVPEAIIEYGYSPTHKADPDRTLRILTKAVQENPDKPREIFYLAREHYYRHAWQVAVNYYDKYLAIATWPPEKADAYLARAKCLLNLNHIEEAKDSAIQAIRIQPTFKEAFEFMAALSTEIPERLQWLRYAMIASNDKVLFVRTKPVYNTSIIIMTKNSDTFDACIERVLKSTVCPIEVIVVNSGRKVEAEGVQILDVPDTTTHIEQLEIGYKAARADYVVAFCDDHFPQDGWLEIAHSAFHGTFPDGLGVLCLNEGLGIQGKKACVTLTNKSTINKLLGGVWYDTAYYQYRVDVDLALRAAKTGKYVYCPDAVVLHKHKGLPMNYPKRFEHDAKVFEERWGKNEEETK